MLLAAQTVLGFGAYLTIGVILSIFIILLTTRLPIEMVFLGGSVILLATGTMPVQSVLSGFSAPVVVTVGALFVVTAGLESTGFLKLAMLRFFGRPRSIVRALLRMIVNVSVLSAFMSNTLVVSMLTPAVKSWARMLGIAPSKLLIPLSYSSCVGGMCLLIGTPANLVISEFYVSKTQQSLNMFAPFVPGVCMVALGAVLMVVLNRLLPSRKTAEDSLPELARSYSFKVPRGNHLVGMTLGDADVPIDDGRIRLTGIIRFDGEMCGSPCADDFIMGGDTLYFSGSRRHAVAVARRSGLDIPETMATVGRVRVNRKMMIAMTVFAAMVIASAFFSVPLVTCGLVAAFAMGLFGCCTITVAKKAVNWDILMVFAGSVVLGKAVDQTGIASVIAGQLLDWCGSSPRLALLLMCLVALLMTEFVSNTACGAVMAPIAAQIAIGCGASPLPFFVGLMVSCSSSFMTPIGSPTHLIVFSPGGYRFSDFLRLGVPMSILSLLVATLIVPLIFPFAP